MEQLRLFDLEELEEDNPAHDLRTLRMVEDCLDNDEPFFVLRAKDIFSVMAVRNYGDLVEKYGPLDFDFQKRLLEHAERMREWQVSNPSLVKYPD